MMETLQTANLSAFAAQAKLEAIATDFNLDPRRDAEYADFISTYGILFNKISTGDTTFTTAETNTLEVIAYRHSTLAAGLALVMLEEYAGQGFLEVLVQPDYQGKSNKSGRTKVKPPKIELCKVYPNPTSGILMVEIPMEFENISASLTDITGRMVLQEGNLNGMATINLRNLAPGSYTLQLKSVSGKLQETHRIELAK